MISMTNSNETVDSALNKVIIKDENLRCLCGITMEKKCWGYITIILEEISPIEL